MKKHVVYYRDSRGRYPVRDFIFSLSPDERDKCLEYISYLEEVGEEIRRPMGDYLGGKLYELRPKQSRILYFFMLKDYAVLLHAFRKKTWEVPEREMKIALRNRADFVSQYYRGQIRLED